jgi:hypothetical protein
VYPLEEMFPLAQLQDCCNKFTAIYHGMKTSREYLFNLIYTQWFKGHQTDIEFGTFPAKLLRFQARSASTTIADAIETHKVLCSQVEDCKRILDDHDGQSKLPYEHSFLHVNWDQRDFYRLLPLFRALIVVIDHENFEPDGDPQAKMVLTGETEGLSAPIDFDHLVRKGKGGLHTTSDSKQVLQTTLKTAIRFVISLNQRELRALGDPRDRRVLDYGTWGFGRPRAGVARGWTEVGPSYTWVDCPDYSYAEE